MRLKIVALCLLVSMTAVAQGRYTKTKSNPDGTITCMEYVSCFACKGSTVCSYCNGQGGKMSGYGSYARYHQCFSCNGRGVCGTCYGAGDILVGRYITIPDANKNPELVKLPNGYCKVSSDGKTRTKTSYTRCGWCQGLNVCKTCNGAGVRNIGTYSYPRYETCHSCVGKGTCSYCDNNGMVKKVTHVNYNSGEMLYVNETSGYVSSGNIYDSQGSSSGESGLSRTGCNACKGTGWYCEIRLLAPGHPGTWCSYCKEKVPQAMHIRKKCDVCKGVGSY